MKKHIQAGTTMLRRFRPFRLFVAAVLLAQACLPLLAGEKEQFRQVNLVSDLPGVALLQDTNLVNAWGVAFSASSPFWISANGTGKALLYAVTNDAAGNVQVAKQGLEVTIPGEGNPTGQVFNNLGGFHTNIFLFVSEDGTISGWRPALGTNAETLLVRTGAVYKGVALLSTTNGPRLLAANFSEATLDVYDGNLNLVGQFADPNAPAGFAPFNVQLAAGQTFVTYAVQDADKEDDVAGPGNGLIDVFNVATGAFHRFATGTSAGGRLRQIDSPWGVVLSPPDFDGHGDELLVGNFGSGTIMAFNAEGKFKGLLQGCHGQPITIEGLWALTFGNGGRGGNTNTLYFTAGPDDESHGLFGSLSPVNHGNDQDGDNDNQGDDNENHGHGKGKDNGNGNGNQGGHKKHKP